MSSSKSFIVSGQERLGRIESSTETYTLPYVNQMV